MGAPDAVAVAGCTDLMVVDTATGRRHGAVVDLQRLPELAGVRDDGGWIDIGAAVSFSQLRREALVAEHAPILVQAAATIGGWQIQNRATIGGNIANASPVGDSLPVLLALGAELVLASSSGERRVSYADFHRGYRETVLEPGGLIVRVRVPHALPDQFQGFKKVGTREAQAISKVVVALSARRVEVGGQEHLADVRLGAGAVAAMPIRLRRTEALLEGAPVGADTATRAAREARAEVNPIDDARSTARYRAHVLGRVVRRLVGDISA
ncbi:Nicotinate dehydrogenase FAD-subunit [Planctomycetes bacterium Pla86]|uniref:Nicotinate dehydrogenase FAD-subunit n=2 Tax=Engelhardtia mirabilis TaxID=2528011 RepID=A0A518BMG4_9BACT|nr:Nicotinate dehydrogenase FAD-subunit [Planctomycetes bacterium Pla133]QDV02469.1 Nicotinate dehydrogenase FAD-subunit [Planctomycetes bacterium Pla86]